MDKGQTGSGVKKDIALLFMCTIREVVGVLMNVSNLQF